MFQCGKCPSSFGFKSSLLDHEKIHNEKPKKIKIGSQMFSQNMTAGPSNSQLNRSSLHDNTPDTYMAVIDEFKNTNTLRVINDGENAEIESMAIKLKEKNQQQLPKYPEDIESIKGRFCWTLADRCTLPCIIRLINGLHVKFSSLRMIEMNLLSNYLDNLHPDIYKFCTSLRSCSITDVEANLLNSINYDHANCVFKNKMFITGKDLMIQLEDVYELYTFLEVCYKTLMSEQEKIYDKFGFIRIDFGFVVPYININNQKFVPLIYFDGNTEQLLNVSITIEKFNLAYLKFCCLIQGTLNEFVESESCTMVNLDDIKKYFNPESNFEMYWPTKEHYSHLLLNHKPPQTEHVGNTVFQIPTASTSMESQSMPAMMSTNENIWSENNEQCQIQQGQQQIINTPPIQQIHFEKSVRSHNRRQRINYHQRNLLRDSIVIDDIDLSSPPSSPAPEILPSTSLQSNVGFGLTRNTEQMIIQDNTSDNANYVQLYQTQQQQQHQQIISTPPTQQVYRGKYVRGRGSRRLINIIQRNNIKNSNDIDMLSPSSSSALDIVPSTSHQSNVGLESTRKTEQIIKQDDTSENAEYKFQQWYQTQHRQQIINTPSTRQPYRGKSIRGRSRRRLINTQQRYNLRNTAVIADIDLSSPPSSPSPNIVPSTSHHSNVGLEIARKSGQMIKQDNTSDNFEYQFQQWHQLQQQRRQQQIVTTPQTQLLYRGKPVRGRRPRRRCLVKVQHNYNLRNAIVIDDIDLSSPPSSPGPGVV